MLSVARDMDAALPMAETALPLSTSPVARFEIVAGPAAIEAEWRAFEATAIGHVFQAFDFVTTWLATVGAARRVRPAIVVGRGRDGTILCLLPFGIRAASARGSSPGSAASTPTVMAACMRRAS